MATPITGSACDRETSGNGIQPSDARHLSVALGHKQTFASQQVMSALPPQADIRR